MASSWFLFTQRQITLKLFLLVGGSSQVDFESEISGKLPDHCLVASKVRKALSVINWPNKSWKREIRSQETEWYDI